MDRFASVTAFVRVAESGGFSAAGRRLNLSKATLSDQVQALENALGVRLLNRTTRRVSLTEIGRSYYERCVQILHELEEADETAGAQGNPARPASRSLPTGHRAVHHAGRGRLSRSVPRSVGRSALRSRDVRYGRVGLRLGDQPVSAGRHDPCQTVPGDIQPGAKWRPGLSRTTSGAAIRGRPHRSQLPALPLRAAVRGGVARRQWQSGGGAHIGKPDQQQPRYNARRRGSRHRPGADGAIHGCRFALPQERWCRCCPVIERRSLRSMRSILIAGT